MIASSTDTIPDPNRIVGIQAWKVYSLIHDKKAYEQCKILADSQKVQLFLADSLITKGEGRIIVLEEENKAQAGIIVENNTQFDSMRSKKNGQIKKLTGIVILETVLIILIII